MRLYGICLSLTDLFLKKLQIELLFDPVIPLLGMYHKNPKTPIEKNIRNPYVHSSAIYNGRDLEIY